MTHERKPISVDTIARIADRGGDISRYFAKRSEMKLPIQLVKDSDGAKQPQILRLRRSR
jgi:hypothetical protein